MTKVIFFKEEGEPLAVFPELKDGNNNLQCYARIGQHSVAHKDYIKTLPVIREPKEYNGLKRELTELGYTLKIVEP